MSLAQTAVAPADFDLIYEHVTTHKVPYTNMHMRQARKRNGSRVLRYLHAVYAPPPTGRPRIDGMISGPDVFWQYQLIRTRTRTQLNLLAESAPQNELERIQRRFLSEIMSRISQERSGTIHHPRRLAGQYYLRRARPGTSPSHPHCQEAVRHAVLDARFVSTLESWDLQLLHP